MNSLATKTHQETCAPGSPFWFRYHPHTTEIRAALHAVLARGVRGDGHGWEAREAKTHGFSGLRGNTHTQVARFFLSFVASLLSLLSLQIIFTGHSLGGALATLSSVDVAQTIRPGLRGVTDMENQWQTAVSLKCTMATMVYLFNLLTVTFLGIPHHYTYPVFGCNACHPTSISTNVCTWLPPGSPFLCLVHIVF